MSVKPFKLSDLDAFVPNEYSAPELVLPLLTGTDYQVRTLWGDDDMVQAIICFRNYWGPCWSCFVLISANFKVFNAHELRCLIERYMTENYAVRLQTESRAEPTLRKWHKFLGFEHEGIKRKMMHGQDFDCWAIVK